MNSLTVNFRGGKAQRYSGPSVWNEVTRKAFLLWVAVLYSRFDEEMKLRLGVMIFYGIPENVYRQIKESLRIQLLPSLENLFKANRLNAWLIPHLRIGWNKYYGPADKLSNLTAYEFFQACEPLYWRWKTKQDEDALTTLCAVLYRPRRSDKVNDDLREEYTDHGRGRRTRLFRFVRLNTKRAIAFNYEGCRNFITGHFPKVFKQGSGGGKPGDVTLSLAGGALGDLNSTRKTNLYDFLTHLDKLIREQEEMKK